MEKFNSVDEILDFAISREVEANDLYVKLAAMVEKPKLAKLLSDLASEELEHKAKLEGIKAGKVVINAEEIGSLGIDDYLEKVEPHAKMSYVELLVVAIKKEEKSRKLYSDLASIAKKQELKDMFLRLAQEEAEHKLRFEVEYDLTTF